MSADRKIFAVLSKTSRVRDYRDEQERDFRTETTTNCIHCHGKMSRSIAPFHVDRTGYHLSFDTIPAWVCNQCGEAYFEEREVSAIQTAGDGLDRQTRQLSASV